MPSSKDTASQDLRSPEYKKHQREHRHCRRSVHATLSGAFLLIYSMLSAPPQERLRMAASTDIIGCPNRFITRLHVPVSSRPS